MGTVTLIEVPALAISSTDCRARVLAGEPVWYLVPDGVVQYIGKHRLCYRGRLARPVTRDRRAAPRIERSRGDRRAQHDSKESSDRHR